MMEMKTKEKLKVRLKQKEPKDKPREKPRVERKEKEKKEKKLEGDFYKMKKKPKERKPKEKKLKEKRLKRLKRSKIDGKAKNAARPYMTLSLMKMISMVFPISMLDCPMLTSSYTHSHRVATERA